MTSKASPVALISGVTGQDGSYLAEDLAARGWMVHGLVRPSSSIPPGLASIPQLRLHTVDITDLGSVTDVVTESAPDHVFHLAGLSSVWQSWKDPCQAAHVNAMSATCFLEACLLHQERSGQQVSFINASSAEIFAGCSTWPQSEVTAIQPTSPYGVSKSFSHHLTQVYRARGLKTSNAILYSHESPRRSELFVTRKITKAAAQIAINGTGRLILGNLDARRDWGWAPDYVRAMTLMSEHPDPDDYVVATGVAHSVREFVQFAFEAAGVSDWEKFLMTDPDLARASDPKILVGDPSKASQRLGWSATLDVRALVQQMVERDFDLALGRKTSKVARAFL